MLTIYSAIAILKDGNIIWIIVNRELNGLIEIIGGIEYNFCLDIIINIVC